MMNIAAENGESAKTMINTIMAKFRLVRLLAVKTEIMKISANSYRMKRIPKIRIAEIDAEFKKMLSAVSEGNIDTFDEEHANKLMNEKQRLTIQLEQYANTRHKRESAKSRLDQIFTILDGMQNHPMEYDDQIVRQILECVVVESKETIKVVFIGGLEVREQLIA